MVFQVGAPLNKRLRCRLRAKTGLRGLRFHTHNDYDDENCWPIRSSRLSSYFQLYNNDNSTQI